MEPMRGTCWSSLTHFGNRTISNDPRLLALRPHLAMGVLLSVWRSALSNGLRARSMPIAGILQLIGLQRFMPHITV